jgi:hypothetical protein
LPPRIVEIEVPERLRKQRIERIAKEYGTIVVHYADIPIRFAITSKDWDKAMKSFRGKAADVIHDEETIQAIEACLSKNYLEIVSPSGADNNVEQNSPNPNEEVIEKIDVSFDNWYSTLIEKYQMLYSTVQDKLPTIWPSLEFALSVKSILNIKDCTLPFAGILLASPGSAKTVVVQLFKGWRRTYSTDSFTAKAFVSHSTAVSREELAEIDMLPKIKDKMLLTPELAPLFTSKEEDLANNFGIITRVLDGHGYVSDSGAHGQRGYPEDIMFVWLGAAVEIPYVVQKLLGNLGHRLYFLRPPKTSKSEDDYLNQLSKNDFAERVGSIRAALFDYLKWFESCPLMESANGLSKMRWNPDKDDEQAKRCIIRLAGLLGHLRGVVLTRETKDTQGLNYAYTTAIIEEPDKALTPLYNLARGHALSQGRDHVTMDDVPLVIRVVLSSAASIERVKALDLLIENKGLLDTSQLADGMNTSKHTALRTMAEFRALELCHIIHLGEGDAAIKQIQLKQDFAWFLTEEFNGLRKGFEPAYHNNKKGKDSNNGSDKPAAAQTGQQQEQEEKQGQQSVDKYCIEECADKKEQQHEEKYPGSSKDNLFWCIFEELNRASNSEGIPGDLLRGQMVSSKKFSPEEATKIIEDKVKDGSLEGVDGNDRYRWRRAGE